MILLPELLIEDALHTTLALIQADRRNLLDFFAGVPPALLADTIAFFEGWEDPDISPAFAKDERDMPTISVKGAGFDRQSETEPIGQIVNTDWDENHIGAVEQRGARYLMRTEIAVFADNQQQAGYLLSFILGTLELREAEFADFGLYEMAVSGSELKPDTKTLAFQAYRYNVTVTFSVYQTISMRYNPTPTTVSDVTITNTPQAPGVGPASGYIYP